MSNVRGLERLKFGSKNTEGTLSRDSGPSSGRRERRRGVVMVGDSTVSSRDVVLRFVVDMFARSRDSRRSGNAAAGIMEDSLDPIRMCSSMRPCLKCCSLSYSGPTFERYGSKEACVTKGRLVRLTVGMSLVVGFATLCRDVGDCVLFNTFDIAAQLANSYAQSSNH